FLTALSGKTEDLKQPGKTPPALRTKPDSAERQHRQVKELEEYTQKLARESGRARAEFFWKQAQAATPREWEEARAELKNSFWENLIGRFPSPTLPINARSRPLSPTTGL